jgi:hypothetical protein
VSLHRRLSGRERDEERPDGSLTESDIPQNQNTERYITGAQHIIKSGHGVTARLYNFLHFVEFIGASSSKER